jgi:protein-arginine kinase activator protein McsA
MECQDCGQESEELTRVKVGRRVYKLCEDCAQKRQESSEIAGEAESAMRDMMEYKGKR